MDDQTRESDELCEYVSTLPIKFTISQPVEFPGRTMPYAVRWRLNGRGYWRSFTSRRGNNGADVFYSLLKVAAMNERDWSSDTGLPSKWKKTNDLNVAQYCRLYIQDKWQRISPSTRKSYVEALTSFIVNCARRGVSALREMVLIVTHLLRSQARSTVSS